MPPRSRTKIFFFAKRSLKLFLFFFVFGKSKQSPLITSRPVHVCHVDDYHIIIPYWWHIFFPLLTHLFVLHRLNILKLKWKTNFHPLATTSWASSTTYRPQAVTDNPSNITERIPVTVTVAKRTWLPPPSEHFDVVSKFFCLPHVVFSLLQSVDPFSLLLFLVIFFF